MLVIAMALLMGGLALIVTGFGGNSIVSEVTSVFRG